MRTIDRILDLVDTMEGLSDVEREVLRFRIEEKPRPEEISAARLRLAPKGNNNGWDNVVHPSVDFCGTEYK